MEEIVELQAPEMRPFYVTKNTERTKTVSVVAPKGNDNCSIVMARRSKKTEKLMRGIDTFFSNPEHMGKLLPFLISQNKKTTNKPRISLRLIEWFVTDYCMHHSVDWFLDGQFFNVFLDYQTMMNEYRKKRFDPFGRKWRKETSKNDDAVQVYHGIRFFYSDTEYVITTVAQLNFFRWLIEKKILDYIIEHHDQLKTEMSKNKGKGKDNKEQQVEGIQQQQQLPLAIHPPLQQSKMRIKATQRVTKKHVEVIVSFD